ncbi:aldehyde dehydrogenase (NAD+) [Nocardioides sp. J9]|uniref:aldehyde dehydrogenase family protein n=1 Tax=Nocardioides sp. J9 TaxID=935844 RepID=UPI0011A3EF73|nr:aldehyde dehydrogenase family protein [Nocardioides sp. J9]TWG98577.1 aldehyde dehydrogenase (NAD+) [Nocardioides sp. J9]
MNPTPEDPSSAAPGLFRRLNPARLSDVVGDFDDADAAAAEEAVVATTNAYPAWDATSITERAALLLRAAANLRQRADSIGAAITREEGKPLARAVGEVVRSAETLEYFAGSVLQPTGVTVPSLRPGVRLETRRHSLGPVLVVTPFNFPAFLAATKLGPALLWGNTVVWKPSPHVPVASSLVHRAFLDAGIPQGAVELVLTSDVETSRFLVAHDGLRAISFTGSTAVGLAIGRAAAERHVRIQQELGGKNVLAVARDVPVAEAAAVAVESAFGESGQKCTAAGLVVVDAAVYDDFMAQVEKEMSHLVLGEGVDPEVAIGPLIDAPALEHVHRLVEASVAAGARVELEGVGENRVRLEQGYFFVPRVVRLPSRLTPLQTEETFGPILTVVPSTDLIDDALALIRASRMGLSASVLTHDLRVAERFVAGAEAGLIGVNLPTTGVEFQVPFGGWNNSGGPFPEAGPSARDFYTRNKTVAVNSLGL